MASVLRTLEADAGPHGWGRVMRSNVEKCPYCGRFMRYEDDAEWGERWVCAEQSAHILADPEHWSVDTIALPEDAVDIDGDPVSGMIRAELLTTEQLRIALGVDTHPTGSSADHEIRSVTE